MIAINIFISNASSQPIYDQIYSQIKALIISGELQTGEPLPSIRNLAKDLRISVITTKRAYSDLERDGFIETVTGKGSFVANQNLAFIREEQLRLAEEFLQKAVDIARSSDISWAELSELLKLLYKGE